MVTNVQKGDQMSIPTFEELRESSDEKLISNIRTMSSISHVAAAGSEAVEAQIYLNELARRDQEKQTKTIENNTKWMTFMTAIILVLTVILVVRDFIARAN
jgi:hypothetical protein